MTASAANAANLADETADLARRFSGLERLYGVLGAKGIRSARVVVVGIGGVGSWAAEALARSGVGHLTLVDLDHIAESNINRQIHALTGTLGQAKVMAMRERIAQINPECAVTSIEDFVTPNNWPALLNLEPTDQISSQFAVLDACDQAATKVALARWARHENRLFISVGAAGGKRHAHQVQIDDLAKVTHDPLLARVRNQLRQIYAAPREGRSMGIQCVYSAEPVAEPDASCSVDGGGDGSLNCSGYGSVVSVTATFGLCAAGWLLDRLATTSQLFEN